MKETTQDTRQRRRTIDGHAASPPTASAITEGLSTRAHEAVDHVAQTVEKVRERAGHATKMARDAEQRLIESASRQTKVYARKHPIATFGNAFAAGIVLSALLKK
jgi:ElaB/YqjD/DUF883 family membrane-anchored ribosome-binding protein